MASYEEWKKHFMTRKMSTLNGYLKAIAVLEKDPMIKREYGHDLTTLAILIQNAQYRKERGK